MGLRKVLFIIAGATFACLLICVVVFVIGIRAARNSVHDDVANAISAIVSRELVESASTTGARTITLDADDLAAQIATQYQDDGVHSADVVTRFASGNEMTLGLTNDRNDVTYTAVLDVENGALVVRHIDGNIHFLNFLLSPGRVGSAIEDGINDALADAGVQLQAIRVSGQSLILTVIPEG